MVIEPAAPGSNGDQQVQFSIDPAAGERDVEKHLTPTGRLEKQTLRIGSSGPIDGLESGIMMRVMYTWLAGLVATSLAVVVCFFWLDRPIALWVHGHFALGYHGTLVWFSRWPDPLVPMAALTLVVLGVRAAMFRSLPANYQAAGIFASLSVLAAQATIDQLKFIFGRPWPESWMGNNPSFIRDGAYGFHFLRGSAYYQSFPSGHMAGGCALIAVLWFWYPRWRALYSIAVLGAGLGLVTTNYHFLSDVVAGAFVGISIGSIATMIWRLLVAMNSRGSSDSQ